MKTQQCCPDICGASKNVRDDFRGQKQQVLGTDGQGEKEEEVYDGSEVSGLGNLTGAGPTH